MARKQAFNVEPPGDLHDYCTAAWVAIVLRLCLLRHRCRSMLHDFFFPGQPLFSERAAMTLIGKRVRVWVVYEDENRRRLGDNGTMVVSFEPAGGKESSFRRHQAATGPSLRICAV